MTHPVSARSPCAELDSSKVSKARAVANKCDKNVLCGTTEQGEKMAPALSDRDLCFCEDEL